MKTKLTLFVTILAVALFGVGCASIPKGPPHPNAVIWNGHWYAYFPDQISWMDAKKHCENLGGHLVVIEEREENEFVWKLASAFQTSGYMHLGCSRTGDNGKWVWLDGRLVSNTFHNWIDNTALGRPFNDRVSIPKIDSGGMSMNQVKDVPPKKWQVRGPSARNGFICEWE